MISKLRLRFYQRYGSFQLSAFMLITLLQRSPAMRLFAAAESVWVKTSLGQVLKASAIASAVLGSVDTLVGATSLVTNPASPVEGTVGTPFAGVFSLIGNVTVGSYTIAGLPPGLSVPNATMVNGLLTLNASNASGNIAGTITGTPTQAGTFSVRITAWDDLNHQGESFLGTYDIMIAEAADTAPAITTQPSSLSVNPGQAAVFSVTATGSPSPAFQWRKNGTNIPGATSSTLTIASAGAGDAATYSVVLSNSVGSVTSTGAVLTVTNAAQSPSITSEPQSWSVLPGDPVTFSVEATGTPTPAYQWRKNNVAINGAIGKTYTIAHVGAADVAEYTVVVYNSAGSVISTPATIVLGRSSGDFNRDGKSDLFLSNTVTGDRVVWLMNAATVGTNAFAGNVPVNWTVSGTGDFNGDGMYDVLWTNTTTGDRAMWLMNGGTAIGGGYLGAVATLWAVSGVGDFNGDGKADILWTNTVTGERAIWFMNGETLAGGATLGVIPLAWTFSGVGDCDGDGNSDIVLSNTVTGDRVIWLMNGATIKTNSYIGNVPTNWTISATGDFNGDGKSDIFWTNTTTGDRAVWLMNGGAAIGGGYLGAIPLAWTVARTGDFNGDGKSDIFWTNTSTGERALWFMDGDKLSWGATLGITPVDWLVAR